MPFKIKKGWAITLIFALILIILNPTYSDFKDFNGNYDVYMQKKSNFILFSFYIGDEKRYLGILKNFILIPDIQENSTLKEEILKKAADTTSDGLPIIHPDTLKLPEDVK